MKKLLSICLLTLLTTLLAAQVSKTVNVTTAGTLTTLLTVSEKTSITNLTITGDIDARDIKCLRDEMTNLTTIDIEAAIIKEYSGTDGTGSSNYSELYPANEMPSSSFMNNSMIKTIILPSELKSIGSNAFNNCINLTGSLTIPSGVRTIGIYAFNNCSGLIGSLSFPAGITNIGFQAFYNCSGFTGDLIIPDGVSTIESNTFSSCSKITSITLGKGINTIGIWAFGGCSGLIEFKTHIDNLNYSSLNGVLFNKDQTALIQCPVSKSGTYTVPNTVTSIGNYAFHTCNKLNSIILPTTGLTNIGMQAFYDCTALTGNFTIPSGNLGQYALANCDKITSITIGNEVGHIDESAFNSCSGIIEFITQTNNPNFSVLDGVLFNKNQSSLLFCPRAKLGNYSIPNTVNIIESHAFATCTNIESINIGNGVTNIKDVAFWRCYNLSSLIIGSNVVTIGNHSFRECNGLKTIYNLQGNVPALGTGCFYGVTSVTDVFVPSNEAVTAYKADTDWYGYFPGNIIKKDQTTETSDKMINEIKIYPTNSEIIIDGTSKGETITLYTVTGQQIQTVASKGVRLNFSVDRDAVYLVKTEKKTYKVIM